MEYAGEIFLGTTSYVAVPNLTADCARDLWTVRGITAPDSMAGNPINLDYDALVSPEPGRQLSGNVLGCFEEILDKIIVTPRKKNLGFVLNRVEWIINVWNTHRDKLRTVSDILILGSGNLEVSNPHGLPHDIGPQHSRNYYAAVPRDGDVTIAATARWQVNDETGTDETVQGMRVIVVPAMPDWGEAVKEKTQYLTNIMAGYSGKEQRFSLRRIPRTRLDIAILPTDKRQAAAMEAMLYGNAGRIYCVPFWPDSRLLLQNLSAGGTIVYCDTQQTKFRAGGVIIIWRDFFTTEAASISSVENDRILLTAPINASWAADQKTYCIPGLTGIIDGETSLARLSSSIFDCNLAFQCDPAPDVTAAAPALVYGYDVLPWQPNLVNDRAHSYAAITRLMDFSTGGQRQINRSGVTVGQVQGYLLTLQSRAEIANYRAWLALRKGQQKSFWMPSWQNDLVQINTTSAGEPTLVIEKSGYTAFQYSQPARRYLAIRMLDGTGRVFYRKVVSSSDGGNIETLTLDSELSATEDILPGSTMVSFLNRVRLANDEPELNWHARDVAEVVLDLIELPLEVTA
jgi:hypothetical protein